MEMLSPRKTDPKSRTRGVYPYELRLKAVKLHLEEGPSRELEVGEFSVSNWMPAYRQGGEDVLRNKPPDASLGKRKLLEPVTTRMLELKKAEPSWTGAIGRAAGRKRKNQVERRRGK